MTMYLIEVKKTSSGNSEPVNVIECNDFMTARDDAISSYAGTSNVVIVRRASSPEAIASLSKHQLQICYGGPACSHKSQHPHLFRFLTDPKKIAEIIEQ